MVGGRELRGADCCGSTCRWPSSWSLMLFPFYWMLITSIKPNRELYSRKIMPLIVHQPTLKHYVDLLDRDELPAVDLQHDAGRRRHHA